MRHREDELLEEIRDLLIALVECCCPQPKNFATTAQLGVALMATTATLTFVDADGNPAAPPTGDGSGITVTFASDNPAVTVGTATGSGDTATAPITGTEAFNLSAVVANTSGAALLDDDGVTAFVQPTAIAVPAAPAPQATSAVLSAS